MPIQHSTNPAGLPVLHISHSSGASIDLHLNGAATEKWVTASGARPLFVTPTPVYAKGKPLRGGIPICWPQFSNKGPLPAHGYARNSMWEFIGSTDTPDFTTTVVRLIQPNVKESPAPPYALATVEYILTLAPHALTAALRIRNNASSDLSFTGALHTYLSISDVTQIVFRGALDSAPFENSTTQGKRQCAPEPLRHIAGFTERIYFGVEGREIQISDPGAKTITRVTAENFSDAVVWNPWNASTFSDMPPDAYRHFICVESAQVKNPIRVGPGKTWVGHQQIRVSIMNDPKL